MTVDPIWSLAGAFVAGEAYAVLAASRLGAFPTWATLAIGAVTGAGAATPFLVLMVRQRLRGRRADPDARLQAFCRALAQSTITIAVVQAVNFSFLQKLWGPIGLAEPPAMQRLVVIPALVLVAALAAARLVDRVGARMVARRVAPATLFGAAMAVLVLGAMLVAPSQRPGARPPAAEMRGPARAVPRRVVIAIDGLGADMLDRFADHMPNLTRFAASSARGALVAEPPVMSSPVWTAVATGIPVAENGVQGNFEVHVPDRGFRPFAVDKLFVDPFSGLLLFGVLAGRSAGAVELLPGTSTHRRGEPFWLAGARDERVAVVCWLATWPPDPVNGVVVTDRWPPEQAEFYWPVRRLPDEVFPERYAPSLTAARRVPARTPDAALLAMASLSPEDWQGLDSRSILDPFLAAYFGQLHDASCLDAAKRLQRDVQPDLLVVYLDGPDEAGHGLLPDPDVGLPWFEPELARRLLPFMGRYLEWVDAELAWTLELGDADTLTVVLSDHGLRHDPGNLLFHNWHAGAGFVLAHGPGFEPGQSLGSRPPEAWNRLLANGSLVPGS